MCKGEAPYARAASPICSTMAPCATAGSAPSMSSLGRPNRVAAAGSIISSNTPQKALHCPQTIRPSRCLEAPQRAADKRIEANRIG